MQIPTTTRAILGKPSRWRSSFCRYAAPVFMAIALSSLMGSIAPRFARGERMLYWAVSCLVTIYFWTATTLRDTVSEPSLWRRAAPIFRRVPAEIGLQEMWRDHGISGTAAIAALVAEFSAGNLAQHTRHGQVAQPLGLFVCMLMMLCVARAIYRGKSACVSVSSHDDRDLKAVRT
jgi:lipopolysaccharide export LptBFGC system permease protein LptF